MSPTQHSAALEHLERFITAPGETDALMVIVGLILVGSILAAGAFFFWLHSLPERMVHNRIQFDIVAVLVLLSLFTHVHAFWVAALLLALIKFPDIKIPDFLSPLHRIANSTEKLATAEARPLTAAAAQTPAPTPNAPQVAAVTHEVARDA